MKNILTPLILFVYFIFNFASPTYATPVGLSVDPPLLKIQIKPGKSITKSFKVENIEDTDKSLVVRLIPFNKSDHLGNPVIDLKNRAPWLNYFGLSNSNIKLDEPFLLKAHSIDQIILSLAVPEDANLEDIYVTLLISTYDNNLTADQKGTLISASIGANILATITSDLNPTTLLKIDKIIPLSGSFLKLGSRYFADNLSPLTFSAIALNNGLFITETKGTFKVLKKSIVLQLQGILPQYVLAKGSRLLIGNDGNPFSFSPSLSTIGTHTITIDIKSDNSNTSNSIEVFFLPFKASLALLLSLFIIKIIFSVANKKSHD